MTLTERVLETHVTCNCGDSDFSHCAACFADDPCDAYRLAVMVREVEVLCRTEEVRGLSSGRIAMARDILAITKEET